MRPIELTLDGFRSYHGPAVFRWEDRHLVGVVGPIGSGKTTILDGISFALYARTPRGGANVSDLVGQRRQEGKVALVFEVDGSRWKVVRSLRKSGQSAHALYEVIDGQDVNVADRAREVTARVEQLLGLDFAAFQRSVMLAQGEFDAFLSGTTGDRDAVLKGVFDLGRLAEMRTAAQMAVARPRPIWMRWTNCAPGWLRSRPLWQPPARRPGPPGFGPISWPPCSNH
ncbi:SMC family ATPase [bacterium]|nr:SMC family ATPase [bacterium]